MHQRFRRAWLKRNLELAILAAHQPDIAFERHFHGDVAFFCSQRNQLLE
jgi:hypothetical protein